MAYETQAASIGGWSQGLSDAPPQSPLSAASNVMDLMAQMSNRVEALADRLCGSMPTSAGGGGAVPTQSGHFNALRNDAEAAYRALERANVALSRIESMLP